MDERTDEGDPDDGDDRTESDREPEAVDPLGQGAAQVTGAQEAGDAAGRAVGQEDAEPDHGLQDRRGDAETGELRGAEVADDGGVGEQEERLGDQGQERRDRQSQDLAVAGRRASSHRKSQ